MMIDNILIQKGWLNLELLISQLIQLQKSEDCNYRNNFKEIRLECRLCKIENKNGRCSPFLSIAKLSRHIDNVHQPTDVDGKKQKNNFIEYLKGLSIVINLLNGHYQVVIDYIRSGVKGGIL